jgi:hypothetical protein
MLESDLSKTLAASSQGQGFESRYCCGSVKKWQEGLPLSSKLFCNEISARIFFSFQIVISSKNSIMHFIIAKVNANL